MSDKDIRRYLINALRSEQNEPIDDSLDSEKKYQEELKRYLVSKLPGELLKNQAPGNSWLCPAEP